MKTILAAIIVVATGVVYADAAVTSSLRGAMKLLEKPQVLHAQDTHENPPVILEAPADDGTSERRSLGAKMGTILPDLLFQVAIAVAYYLLIVNNYPKLPENNVPTAEAKDLMAQNEVEAALETSVSNCLLAWFCPASRAAHTMHAMGKLNFWPACCLMWFCQCPMLWVMSSWTDIPEKLGGSRKKPVVGCLCAFFCGSCMIAKDAEALDKNTGTKTHLFGLRHSKGESLTSH
mmetsp:Transcript_64543/g.120131  ORF Transcript_64543/g.120131 Transcript_64543/m.120131 type:complete len:233 (+) Transcript_64543:47-745(+)